MVLAGVLLELAVVVATMLVTATLVFVGPRRFTTALREFRPRVRACALSLSVLAGVLFVRWSTQDVMPWLSWRIIGQNITPYIYALERTVFGENPVLVLQSFQTPELTSFFVFVYIYGYAFLLSFPFIAYFALEETDYLSTLIVAFTANYGIGLVCYALFIAYGPRNFDNIAFDGLLYETVPQYGYLTHTVNQSVNVFPSLHTSLSVTVFLLAWLTREEYPLWVPVAGVLAGSVVLSTMYLGIHWFSDVVAGTILAAVSVHIGVNYTVEGVLESARRSLEGGIPPGG
ncbi:phosphatase PAP2 family protein [Natrialbaceae archaeon AArc-T1-2]|uniref:phosphatase PAP2 family protein n=1 Tax=Natrialbaceae archaeon AArc-T1-2 TaxID=3053904 RepID=UPI00255A9950|nr:phosphatase PAP2 family protein [Natrialbaceae archaeon AArc-T1-2]WIV67882.1 phosphatase PAP2 family protein [Natrialbaceae archaeon AArc-T1-2]